MIEPLEIGVENEEESILIMEWIEPIFREEKKKKTAFCKL